jgi:hypothetical protein
MNKKYKSPRIQLVTVELGLKYDGSLPEKSNPTLGVVTVGPMGLLNLIETQLGLPNVDVAFTTRLIQYLNCLDKADHPKTFYHNSFEADPFSVARTLPNYLKHTALLVLMYRMDLLHHILERQQYKSPLHRKS